MNFCRKIVVCAAIGAAISMLEPAVASADKYIDFGTNQAACQAAARQANAMYNRYSYCYETGPGHYSLYFAG